MLNAGADWITGSDGAAGQAAGLGLRGKDILVWFRMYIALFINGTLIRRSDLGRHISENLSSRAKSPEAESWPPSDQLPEGGGPISFDQALLEPQPLGRSKRYGLFAAGFLGWFLVNGLWWQLIFRGSQTGGTNFQGSFCILPFSILMLILLGFNPRTRQITWGGLAAIAVNMTVSLALGLFFNAICLIPFFHPLMQ